MLTPAELEEISVSEELNRENDHWLVANIRACGEELRAPLWSADAGLRTYGQIAASLAGFVQEWIAESGFGWGQLRLAEYEIPSATQ